MKLKDPLLLRQWGFIGGCWISADSAETIPVHNPATGEVLGVIPKMGETETRRAIVAAAQAAHQRQTSKYPEPSWDYEQP
jgi:succinate-semialdehyde dehydrogenase/glutarate-semialdehyde dehydrogenase